MVKCNKDYRFEVVDSKHIELRHKDGTFISSICCMKCVDELEKAIKKLRKTEKQKGVRR